MNNAATNPKPSKMPVITLHRPWGYAVAHLGKTHENRSWRCPLKPGTYLAIHNGKKWDSEAQATIERIGLICPEPEDDPPMAIIAIALFSGNVERSTSPWFSGPYGWTLEDVTPIEPVFCKGQQGIWYASDDARKQVATAFKAAVSTQLNDYFHWRQSL